MTRRRRHIVLFIGLFVLLTVLFTVFGAVFIPVQDDLAEKLDENGVYTGFDNLPQDYTQKMAVQDGCYVRENDAPVSGGEKWERFLRNTENGKKASLRIFESFYGTQDDSGNTQPYSELCTQKAYYEQCITDLFYDGERYYIYTSGTDFHTSLGGKQRTYPYLVKVKASESLSALYSIYVLSEKKDITHEEILQYFLSSQLEPAIRGSSRVLFREIEKP